MGANGDASNMIIGSRPGFCGADTPTIHPSPIGSGHLEQVDAPRTLQHLTDCQLSGS